MYHFYFWNVKFYNTSWGANADVTTPTKSDSNRSTYFMNSQAKHKH